MKNTRRILAIVGIILLLLLCISPLIFAIFAKDPAYFRAAAISVIMIPIFLYVILMIAKLLKPQKSPLIDNIIFDIGNVLVGFEWRKVMEDLSFSPETITYLDEHLIHAPLWNEFDEGLRPYEEVADEFCQMHPDYEQEIRTFLKHMPDSIILKPYTHAWLADLKNKGYRLYIVSNWAKPVYEACKDEALSFRKIMDGSIWSYQVKCRKPGTKIFQKLIDTYALDPTRSVFLDDVKENLDGAAKVGLHTILVTGDHKQTLLDLRELGVK